MPIASEQMFALFARLKTHNREINLAVLGRGVLDESCYTLRDEESNTGFHEQHGTKSTGLGLGICRRHAQEFSLKQTSG